MVLQSDGQGVKESRLFVCVRTSSRREAMKIAKAFT
jgi:hypothetical protein